MTRKYSRSTVSRDYLRWLIGLRWIAAAAAIGCGVLNLLVLHWYEPAVPILLVGFLILSYNVVLWLGMKRWPQHRQGRLLAAGAQILLDLGCLTLIVGLTGGIGSPFLGLYVFQMVFSGMLLPPVLAYSGAAAGVALVAAGLGMAGQWHDIHDNVLMLVGWLVTLLLTVWLTNGMTQSLLWQRYRLVRQNRRAQAMSRQLRRQQQVMIQHEKMVTMGQMAAGIAHEIANPLAGMDSLLQLLQRRPERMGPQTIDTLRQQTDRIQRIISQMRVFSHPSGSEAQLLSLNEVVDQALGMLGFDPRLDRVALERQYAPEVGTVRLLPQAMHQVIINLVVNALDAMEQIAKPQLTIRTRREQGWCTVEVIDNGPGFPPELSGRLFEPFFTTKPAGKGTGLGLSISEHLVRKQGGSIEVHSQPGHGARFVVRLPGGSSPGQKVLTPSVRVGEGSGT